MLGGFLGTLTVGMVMSLTLLLVLGTLSAHWTVSSSLRVRTFALSYCILFCFMWRPALFGREMKVSRFGEEKREGEEEYQKFMVLLLYSKFKAHLGYMTPCLKKTKIKLMIYSCLSRVLGLQVYGTVPSSR